MAYLLDHSPHVFCYARNYQLGFSVPYKYWDQEHPYEPDFLVRLNDEWESVLVLEVKGSHWELLNQETPIKHEAAKRWRDAVNNLQGWNGKFARHWRFFVTRDVQTLDRDLARIVTVPPGREDDFAHPLAGSG